MDSCRDTALAAEAYITEHLFDPRGIMYSGIDSHTGQPFAREFITPLKVPRRAAFDPWSYWTYEDSVMTMGLYLDGLVLQHEVTGNPDCLARAERVWAVIQAIYSCSQVHGIGSFLRPYGGYERMERFMEPLGTDQASPLFSGLYRYLPYAAPHKAVEIRRVMCNTLTWYEQQGFAYFYYKAFIHSYAPEDGLSNHANSYFLQAIAWAAATYPDDPRWQRHLDERLGYFVEGRYKMHPGGNCQQAFCWGSDLDILHRILGERFHAVFTDQLLEEAYQAEVAALATFTEPGRVQRVCPESADPNFQPTVGESDPALDVLGFAYFRTRHHARTRPGSTFLLALLSVGYRTQEIAAQVADLLALTTAVPADFTAFLSEDYDLLPETVHLYARSVGVNLVTWWRNYWLLERLRCDG